MRPLVPIFLLMATATAACAQDSATPQQPRTTQSRSGGYDGSRAEVFVNGFGLFGNGTTGNAINQQETQSGGVSVGYRFHLNSSSALEGRYGYSRDSQKYTIGGNVSSVPAYLSEISASYVYSLPKFRYLQPFLEGGGGLVLFVPGSYGGGSTAAGAVVPPTSAGNQLAYIGTNAVYGGAPAGLQTQAKGMFVYGGGADVPVLSKLSVRIEIRGLAYKTPDFGTVAFQTNTFSFVYEPSLGVTYRF
jgi:opacity protein-like surface antigen